MTSTNHHISHAYLTAYQTELRTDLSDAHRSGAPLSGARRVIGRTFVRIGAWLFPEAPGIVDDRIIVLARPIDAGALEKAA